MLRRYELMVILDPNQADEAIDEQIAKIENVITSSEGGEIINTDKWGKKRLAYEIQGRPFGYYVVWEFIMDGANTTELERHCRLDALNLRHLLLHIPEKVLKLKEREKELKANLDERRRRMAEEAEGSPVVDMLGAREEEYEDEEDLEDEGAEVAAEAVEATEGEEEEEKSERGGTES